MSSVCRKYRYSVTPVRKPHIKPVFLNCCEDLVIGRNANFGIRSTKVSRQHALISTGHTSKEKIKVSSVGKGKIFDENGTERQELISAGAKARLVFGLLPDDFSYLISEVPTTSASDPHSAPSTNVKEDNKLVDAVASTSTKTIAKRPHAMGDNDADIDSRFKKLKDSGASGSIAAGDPGDATSLSTGWSPQPSLLVYLSKSLATPARSKVISQVKAHHPVISLGQFVGFDMDGTLIRTKSGARFARDASDWQWLYPNIPSKLGQYNRDGFQLVVFTNQLGISMGKQKESDIRTKAEKICSLVDAPVIFFAAPNPDYNRKPCMGMYDALVRIMGGPGRIDLSQSLYVGDAAGRNKSASQGRDHSGDDRLFALNVGVAFKTPEEFFSGAAPPTDFRMPPFNPKTFIHPTEAVADGTRLVAEPDFPELIMFVGAPASGKSTFASNVLVKNGYKRVNRDTLKTMPKCIGAMREALQAGESVVVDNTSPTVSSRTMFADVARQLGARTRCFHMVTSKDQCFHNERFRRAVERSHESIPDVVIHTYYDMRSRAMIWNMNEIDFLHNIIEFNRVYFCSKFEMPTLSEGYDEVVQVSFVPRFLNEENKRLYSLFFPDKFKGMLAAGASK